MVDRSEFTTTTQVAPGQMRTQVSPQPLNFETDEGWKPVDTTLKERGGVARAASVDGEVAIPSSLSRAIELEHDGRELSVRLLGAAGVPDVAGAAAKVEDAMSGVDVSYVTTPRGVKETLVLASRQSRSVFSYDVRAGAGWSAVVDDRGEVVFSDGKGAERYRITAPLAWDSAEDPGYTNDLALSVAEVSAGRWRVTLRPSTKWLEDPERVFPVTIDPDFSWSDGTTHFHGATDCYLASGSQANYTFCAQTYLQTGHYNRTYKSLFRFDVGSAIPADAVVSAATFNAYAVPATPKALASHSLKTVTSEWDSSATWNKRKPGVPWTTTLGGDVSSDPALSSTSTNVQANPAWYSWTAPVAAVQGWVDGSLPNYGFQLTADPSAPLGNAYGWASTEASMSSQFPASSAEWPTLDVTWSVPDTTDPTLALSGELAGGQSTWRTGASGEVTLSGTDAGSGVKRLEILEGSTVVASETQTCPAGGCGLSHTFTLDLDALGEGIHTLTAAAIDGGNLRTEETFTVRVDRADPGLELTGTLVDDQAVPASTGNRAVHVAATDGGSGVVDVELKVDGTTQEHVTQTCPSGGCSRTEDWSVDVGALSSGSHTVSITATDGAGKTKTTELDVVTEQYPMPQAPPLSETSITPFPDQVDFLYQGPQAVQTGLDPQTLDERRTAVVTGKVFNGEGVPAAGVTVSVADHPEFGETVSRENGQFFLVVNGGAQLRIHYEVQGALPAERQVETKWNDYVWADDVRLVAVDPAGTPVDFGSSVTEPQLAEASTITDQDGTRTARVFVRPGTQAWKQKTNGTLEPLTGGTVRVSEYTVGEGGPERMPAALPEATAYTWAAEFQVDQATAPDDAHVQFSKPVVAYLENFVGLPVGDTVPVGNYAWDRGQWDGDADGRVIKILGKSGGKAIVDVTGFGAANSEELATFDLGDDELEMLADTYQAGDTLWRVELASFSTRDFNKAKRKKKREPRDEDPENPDPDDPCNRSGSIIGCQTQTLGEIADLGGTPYSLRYQSNRTPDAVGNRSIRVPVTGDTLDEDIDAVRAEVRIAGQRLTYTLDDPQPNVFHTFRWDGKDGFGREMVGGASATVILSDQFIEPYSSSVALPAGVDPDDYYWVVAPFFDGGQTVSWGFSGGSGGYMEGVIANATPSVQPVDRPNLECNADETRCWYPVDEVTDPRPLPEGRESTAISKQYIIAVPYTDARSIGVGGLGVSVQHRYDTGTGTLFTGDGAQRSVASLPLVTKRVFPVAGVEPDPYLVGLAFSPMTVLSDGSTLVVHSSGRLIRNWPDGHSTLFAGGGSGPAGSGDGGPAVDAVFGSPTSLATGPDDSVYVGDPETQVVRRIDPQGTITTVAGTGSSTDQGNGRRGPDAAVWNVTDLAVAADGTLYIASSGGLHQLDPSGSITRLAGQGFGCGEDGNPCRVISLPPRKVAVAPDGTVYWTGLAWSGNTHYLYRYTPGEDEAEVLGSAWNLSDGNKEGPYDISDVVPDQLEVDRQGHLWILDSTHGAPTVWRLGAENEVRHIGLDRCGTQDDGRPKGDGGPFRAACGWPGAIARGPDGMYLYDGSYRDTTRVSQALTRYPVGESIVPSEDGTEAYRFDASGRHLATLDGRTERVIRTFSYDGAGRLSAINETDLGTTTITYDANGDATVTGPDGQATQIEIDGDGWATKITDAGGASQQYEYAPGTGLLTRYEDQLGHASRFTWTATGRLLTDTSRRGGVQSLSRTETGTSTQVTHTSAGGQATTYDSQSQPGNVSTQTLTGPDGATSTTQTRRDTGQATATSADGTQTTQTVSGEPRWGASVPLRSQTTTRPSGSSSTTAHQTQVNRPSGGDAQDPFAFTSIVDSYTVDGRTKTSTYDKAARTDTTVSPMGRSSQVEYDAGDRPTRISMPGRDDVTLAYDSRGRPTTVAQGGDAATIAYGGDGRPSQLVDQEGRTTTLARDARGQVTTAVGPDGESVSMGYDAAGQVTSITAPDGRQFTFTYDEDGNLTGATRPSRAGSGDPALSTSAQYDQEHRPTSVTTASGQSVDLDYDSAGRLASTEASDGTAITATYAATGARKLSAVASSDGVQTGFSYDGPLVAAVATQGDGDTPSQQTSVALGYDNAGRAASETIDGDTIAAQYNNDDQLTQVGDVAIAYDSATGDPATVTAGDTRTQLSVDTRGHLAAQTSAVTPGGGAPDQPVLGESVVRDPLGRITTRTETVGTGSPTTYGYTYDSAGRLTAVSTNGATSETYGYDNTGGLTSRGNGILSNWIQTDGHGRPVATASGITAQWSTDGELNQLARPGTGTSAMTYDGLGRIKTITTPTGDVGTYSYDGLGRRTTLRVGGAIVRRYAYGTGLFPIARLDAAGDVLERYIYATKSHVPDLIVRRDGQRLRLITDTLGSVRQVIDTDTGTVVQQLTYDAYGTTLTDTAPGLQPFGYKGSISDPVAVEAGLTWMGVRAYLGVLVRFATPDPAGLRAAWNQHGSFASDPVNLSDPDGRFPSLNDFAHALSNVGSVGGVVLGIGGVACVVVTVGVCGAVASGALLLGGVTLAADTYLLAKGEGSAGSVAWDVLGLGFGGLAKALSPPKVATAARLVTDPLHHSGFLGAMGSLSAFAGFGFSQLMNLDSVADAADRRGELCPPI